MYIWRYVSVLKRFSFEIFFSYIPLTFALFLHVFRVCALILLPNYNFFHVLWYTYDIIQIKRIINIFDYYFHCKMWYTENCNLKNIWRSKRFPQKYYFTLVRQTSETTIRFYTYSNNNLRTYTFLIRPKKLKNIAAPGAFLILISCLLFVLSWL
jgi:hypothetical protein